MKAILDELTRGESPVAVLGLGYVGLPLAVHLGRKFKTLGFDVNEERVARLRQGHDETGEVTDAELASIEVVFTSDPECLSTSRLIIVAVPTPVDDSRKPDLTPLEKASTTIGRHLRPGTVVVFESTVYPGVTEEFCGPIIEKVSGLVRGTDFFLGYSPERVNPGDRSHTLDKIIKVVSGENQAVTELLTSVYGAVVDAGTYPAANIKTAEAAKVIENTQRDLNIALMNELAMIFNRIDLDTGSVLEAAATKWNFLHFKPGLVGGHCIGIDPYYLTFLAEKLGYHPQVILAGRKINDGMGKYVAEQTVKQMIKAGHQVSGARVLVMGLTFKENVPDLRNSKVFDVIRELREYEVDVLVHDPIADPQTIIRDYGLTLTELKDDLALQGIVLCVNHDVYRDMGVGAFRAIVDGNPVLIDVKGVVDADAAVSAGFRYWRL